MAAERLRRLDPRKSQKDDEVLREVREGRASPTIAFALSDESEELTFLLEKQIGGMGVDQREDLRRVLENARHAMGGELEQLEEVDDNSYRRFSSVIGLIIGGTLEAATGIGNLMIGGIGAGLAIEQHLEKSSGQERLRIQERLERCVSLIDAASC